MKSLRVAFRDWLLKDMPAIAPKAKPVKHIETQGTVVEASQVPRWQEIQHGNVIVAEPDVMKEFRRNHG